MSQQALEQARMLMSDVVLMDIKMPGLDGCVPLCDDLTERERKVLALIGKGHSNKEIARLLSISEKTVKNHIANIKLRVYDRTQAVLYAIR